MVLARFQDFLSGLIKLQSDFMGGADKDSMDELLQRLMGSVGEVSGIITARQVLDRYRNSDNDAKLAFFKNLEQNFNANPALVKLAFDAYQKEPTSSNINRLSRAAEPSRQELLRRLNQTPNATHDLVAMRTDLLGFLKDNPDIKPVDEDFVRMFTSWFGRGFLVLRNINWSVSAAILERIIRYEAVHEIKDWDDLRRRIEPANRRCFAYFHPALADEPLIFVQIALSNSIPSSIESILKTDSIDDGNYTTATFYSISNCQPGLNNISFGNFLIKQVVQELQTEFPSIKTFITLSPIPGFARWLDSEPKDLSDELAGLKTQVQQIPEEEENSDENTTLLKKLVFNYLLQAKRGLYPFDPVAKFHLGNGALIHKIHTCADMSSKGINQSRGAMVNYLYDLQSIEINHEQFISEGHIKYSEKLKSLIVKD
ncbi:MAG: malonyl-CoA decarboxylase [Pseudohongiellaceae bacterium]|jgi:malonyl-CoA decarboxylase